MDDTGDVLDPEQHGEAHINLDADDDDRRFIGSDTRQSPFDISCREIKPSGFALLAMVSFGFTDILMERWESVDMDVNIRNSYGYSPLLTARSLRAIKLLVKRGADINTQDDSSETVFIRAIWDEDLETVKFLLQTGRVDVNVDTETAYYSCVLDTATRYSLEILKYLIEHGGADVNRSFKS